ncbi:hypothetical protein [Massilia rubra]|uniref:Thioredoxin domain-containing protein n=1 Tax=Massilia rubra TaxID=2607910 RepID=A0ABX0LND1_9BURK|nr:hypothetical protein [Massilia rubra]NHZ35862.1 hypothetical protein [Massilia rubra]
MNQNLLTKDKHGPGVPGRIMAMRYLFLFLIAWTTGFGGAQANPIPSAFDRFAQVERAAVRSGVSSTASGRTIADAYLRLLPERYRRKLLGSRNRKSLQQLFNAADIAEFYTGDPRFANHMRDAFDALARIGEHKNSDSQKMYEAYISTEQFSQAASFIQKYPSSHLAMPPTVLGETVRKSGEKLWHVDFDTAEIRQVPFVFPKGLFVIVLSATRCHFTHNAVSDIEADPELQQLLAGRTLWLSRVDRGFDLSQIQSWNQQHPAFTMSLASDLSSWKQIAFWETPTFYFFKDGVLVDRMSGWPTKGRKQELSRLIKVHSEN